LQKVSKLTDYKIFIDFFLFIDFIVESASVKMCIILMKKISNYILKKKATVFIKFKSLNIFISTLETSTFLI